MFWMVAQLERLLRDSNDRFATGGASLCAVCAEERLNRVVSTSRVGPPVTKCVCCGLSMSHEVGREVLGDQWMIGVACELLKPRLLVYAVAAIEQLRPVRAAFNHRHATIRPTDCVVLPLSAARIRQPSISQWFNTELLAASDRLAIVGQQSRCLSTY